MPFSTDTAPNSQLSARLQQALPGAVLSNVPVHDEVAPLLIVEADHLVVAFALGEDEQSYDVLYPAFKKLFALRSLDWNSKDVSFVYCLPASFKPSQQFCSSVEVDVYFCRKFVVQLDEPLGESLARLPFLPLAPVSEASLRPPTAQTLLQSVGVRPDLAKQLVMPGRAATGILADCLAGKHGKATLTDGEATTAAVAANADRSSTILKSLTIENFRAYRSKRVFELGSAVTVLYGPNGFGKTSVFDALDFAATGGIGRLPRSPGSFANAARHLDSLDNEVAAVTLTFEKDGKSHSLTRNLNETTKAVLDGRKGVERKEVLNFLTGGETPQADRVENLVSLFRATHLFSQESPELTNDFANTCEVSGEIVSRMLAFEDYVNGVKKAAETHTLARQAMESAADEADGLKRQAEVDLRELERISAAAAVASDSSRIETLFAQLDEGVRALDVEAPVGPDAASLRTLRQELSERLSMLNARRTRLTECAQIASSRSVLLQEAAGLARSLSEATTAAETISKTQSLAKVQAQLAASKSSAALVSVTAKRKRCDDIAWTLNEKSSFDELAEQRTELQKQRETAFKELQELAKEVANGTAQEAEANGAFQAASQNAERSTTAIERTKNLLLRLGQLQPIFSELNRFKSLIAQYTELCATKEGRLIKLRSAVADEQTRIVHLESTLAQTQGQASEIRKLANQLRAHVQNGTCLLCAHDHGSMEALLRAIDVNEPRNSDVPKLAAELAKARDTKRLFEKEEADAEGALKAARVELERAHAECRRLSDQFTDFAKTLAGSGLQLSPLHESAKSVEALVVQLNGLLKLQTDQQQPLMTALRDAVARQERTRVKQVESEGRRQQANTLVTGLDGTIDGLRAGIQTLVRESSQRQVDLALSPTDLAALLAAELKELQVVVDAHDATQTLANKTGQALRDADAQLRLAQVAHRQANSAHGAAMTRIKELGRTLLESGLTEEATRQEVEAASRANSERANRVAAILDRAQALEVALDAAATAAAMQSVRKRVGDAVAKADEAEARAAAHRPWVEYFSEIGALLQERQLSATRQFTEQYGPRTAVIQRRLRPVYGFGDIDITNQGANIAVRVKRNGVSHRPSDFFSQSQVQTLLLGLFLTASSSQTWSGFSPVLMDDPVTHFDDLNTYALLDLISGLLKSPEGSRQFVISTCDEKLLQLARQKFRHLGSDAKFYSFSAIGSDGPMVTVMPS